MMNITLHQTAVSKIAMAGLSLVFFFSDCSSSEPATAPLFNQAAQLTGQLPFNSLQWQPITSLLDSGTSTMSTLYGNDVAVKYTRTHSVHRYPDGAILALVTWSQREDPRWYGGYIPGKPQSVEFVYVHAMAGRPSSYSYQKYSGSPLVKESETPPQRRANAPNFCYRFEPQSCPRKSRGNPKPGERSQPGSTDTPGFSDLMLHLEPLLARFGRDNGSLDSLRELSLSGGTAWLVTSPESASASLLSLCVLR